LKAGHVVTAEDVVALRPATPGCVTPDQWERVLGATLRVDVDFHDCVTPEALAQG
jgi:sialic acid synthase SpsE